MICRAFEEMETLQGENERFIRNLRSLVNNFQRNRRWCHDY